MDGTIGRKKRSPLRLRLEQFMSGVGNTMIIHYEREDIGAVMRIRGMLTQAKRRGDPISYYKDTRRLQFIVEKHGGLT